MKQRHYGRWGGNPDGRHENPVWCIAKGAAGKSYEEALAAFALAALDEPESPAQGEKR